MGNRRTEINNHEKDHSIPNFRNHVDRLFTERAGRSIHVYASGDYKQCIKDVVVNPAWLTPDHDVIATCSSTSSGWCWAGEASNFELKFTNSDGVQVGYVTFHEAYATHFEVHSINSLNGYLITVKTEVVNRASTFEIKVTTE